MGVRTMHDIRLIDANTLRKDIHTSYSDDLGILEHIDNAPTIDAQPVKHGNWILHFDDLFPEESTIECNVCHEHSPADMPHDNFCPACGSYNGGDEK